MNTKTFSREEAVAVATSALGSLSNEQKTAVQLAAKWPVEGKTTETACREVAFQLSMKNRNRFGRTGPDSKFAATQEQLDAVNVVLTARNQ